MLSFRSSNNIQRPRKALVYYFHFKKIFSLLCSVIRHATTKKALNQSPHREAKLKEMRLTGKHCQRSLPHNNARE